MKERSVPWRAKGGSTVIMIGLIELDCQEKRQDKNPDAFLPTLHVPTLAISKRLMGREQLLR